MELRQAQIGDQDFFTVLYDANRMDLRLLPLPAEVLEALILSQQQGQAAAYRATYPRADYLVLENNGVPIGRVVLDRASDRIHLVDLALLPEWQGRGCATTLLRRLQSEAARQGLPLTLKVQATNTRAIALYQRLGFVAIDDDPVFPAMRWSAT